MKNVSKKEPHFRGCSNSNKQGTKFKQSGLASTCPELIKEWDLYKNDYINPESFTAGSSKKVWWLCSKGHSWEAAIFSRALNNNGCPYCAGQKAIVGENDLATTNPELVIEWDYRKNEKIKPEMVMSGSKKKVWWICEKGHSWQANVSSRARLKSGCPYCAGLMPIVGENDLATTNPELVTEWDYKKNEKIKPEMVMSGSKKKVWWICEKGHSWQANVSSRARLKSGCPYCAGQRAIKGTNDLGSLQPDLAKEWDDIKNEKIKPEMVMPGSNKKVWWICEKGHSWQATITSRAINHNGCPYCAGKKVLKGFNDLGSKYPQIAKEWNYKKNRELTPDKVTPGSNKKVWWVCPKGHEYLAVISARTNGDNCPYCSNHAILIGYNDLATTSPSLAKEWNSERNKQLKPTQVIGGSSKKVWWKCPNCAYEWRASIVNRKKGSGCPKCYERSKTSFPEQALFHYIRLFYKDTLNGYNEIFDNGMELDIYIPSLRIGLEYDGKAWHKSKSSYEREQRKYNICKKKGITLIRIKENIEHNETTACDFLINIDMKYQTEDFEYIFKELEPYLKFFPDLDIERDREVILSNYYIALNNASIGEKYPLLHDEWNYEKNGKLTPFMFKPGSQTSVWWRCGKCNYEWKTGIQTRVNGSGCPKCGTKAATNSTRLTKLKNGCNSLSAKYPSVAKEWNYKKNGNLTPEDIPGQSAKKVWWICSRGHEWESKIQTRTKNGSGCPYCSGRLAIKGVNDLKTMYPDLSKQWLQSKNDNLTPEMVKPGSNKKVWWICSEGHTWQATVCSRAILKTGCPYCKKMK